MKDTIVSRKPDGTYKATLNGRTTATGDTQNEAGWNGQQERPDAAVVAQRVRDLGVKHEDQSAGSTQQSPGSEARKSRPNQRDPFTPRCDRDYFTVPASRSPLAIFRSFSIASVSHSAGNRMLHQIDRVCDR